jgi:hypothetical protein
VSRKYTSPYLSDYWGKKLSVTCEKCGIKKRYDINALLEKAGDHCMPDLRHVMARALNCPNVENVYSDICQIRLNEADG